ncbi:uncharacterized protein LOC131679224 isoform X1 [Topomyia yanbarensis]|uniref:uncharacterized protein LOC131679224 isoform X1 n=1 Tax=Topomyia yanbarensis TaxID=2498891 RepID=UPI00273C472F|nr:uncharacterized protein LOC131679224 isoform X1 [Topomyia yanbarensis]XP_058815874.1 uncharacterized protein LOC131679224 isoform X1 [Topomyia yanbarensis]XP_058815875.1 uncharacterized protein LOC131679224 isoform X1 [Topomyia yanbarensis]XP_058815876.1 uncharacterized protein LOC131679224 isoform X1 [Topomyia yanbarensis]XP_058815877.1 uncharacterized protein LOC131679224 isoform X1 [Topomyia yanbarensis]XP_058815878.1 uncharacterized protein LOC131679224 isoform X1 [Topomyia yanbarensis]
MIETREPSIYRVPCVSSLTKSRGTAQAYHTEQHPTGQSNCSFQSCETRFVMDPAALGLTEEDVDSIVKRYLQEKRDKYNAKFRVLSYHVKRISEEPIGYLGDHYFLNVVLREKMVHYSEEEEEYAEEEYLSFFMKILPEQVPKLAEYVREMGCFKKEIQLYTHLIPRLQDVTIGTKPFAPRAYLTKNDSLLVSENLQAEGYRMVKNNKSLLDYAHLEVALKSVAKLHAASLVLEERTKQPITKLYSGHLNENVYIDDDTYVRKTNLENAIKALCELIKRIDKYKHSDRLDFILEKFPQVIRKIYDFAKPSTVYRNVFNHGDLWNNNLMFKYEETTNKSRTNSDAGLPEGGADGQQQQCASGERRRRKRSSIIRPDPFDFSNICLRAGIVPSDCIMIDFQIARYSPPAYDVMSLLNTTTTSAFRTVYLERMIQMYYQFLKRELEWFQIDVERSFPAEHFEKSCEEYKLAGLIDSILFRHLTLLPTELVSNCKECPIPISFENLMENSISALSTKAWDSCDNYRFLMADLLADLVDTYILPS